MTKITLYKGDNQEVIENKLKNVKPNIIYMDPPYNTWNSSLTYKDKTTTNKWFKNFCDLLKKIKDISQENSVFFVSINDEELSSVILGFRDILGKDSIISIAPRRTHSGHKTSNTISNQHDFLVIAKKGTVKFNGYKVNSGPYKFTDEFVEKRGKHQLRRVDYKSFKWSESLDCEVEIDGKKYYPGGVTKKEWNDRKKNHFERDWAWIWSKKKIDFAFENGYITIKDGLLYKKTYTNSEIKKVNGEYQVSDKPRTTKIDSLHFTSEIFALKRTKTHPEQFFDYPKSDNLISDILMLPDFEEKIVLDPFGGTGTTAIMANELNLKEVHIIQRSEKTKSNSIAYKNGYKDIYDLTLKNIETRTNRKIKEIK